MTLEEMLSVKWKELEEIVKDYNDKTRVFEARVRNYGKDLPNIFDVYCEKNGLPDLSSSSFEECVLDSSQGVIENFKKALEPEESGSFVEKIGYSFGRAKKVSLDKRVSHILSSISNYAEMGELIFSGRSGGLKSIEGSIDILFDYIKSFIKTLEMETQEVITIVQAEKILSESYNELRSLEVLYKDLRISNGVFLDEKKNFKIPETVSPVWKKRFTHYEQPKLTGDIFVDVKNEIKDGIGKVFSEIADKNSNFDESVQKALSEIEKFEKGSGSWNEIKSALDSLIKNIEYVTAVMEREAGEIVRFNSESIAIDKRLEDILDKGFDRLKSIAAKLNNTRLNSRLSFISGKGPHEKYRTILNNFRKNDGSENLWDYMVDNATASYNNTKEFFVVSSLGYEMIQLMPQLIERRRGGKPTEDDIFSGRESLSEGDMNRLEAIINEGLGIIEGEVRKWSAEPQIDDRLLVIINESYDRLRNIVAKLGLNSWKKPVKDVRGKFSIICCNLRTNTRSRRDINIWEDISKEAGERSLIEKIGVQINQLFEDKKVNEIFEGKVKLEKEEIDKLDELINQGLYILGIAVERQAKRNARAINKELGIPKPAKQKAGPLVTSAKKCYKEAAEVIRYGDDLKDMPKKFAPVKSALYWGNMNVLSGSKSNLISTKEKALAALFISMIPLYWASDALMGFCDAVKEGGINKNSKDDFIIKADTIRYLIKSYVKSNRETLEKNDFCDYMKSILVYKFRLVSNTEFDALERIFVAGDVQ